MKTLLMISIFAIITIGITVQLPSASSDSGSLTELYTPSPDLTKMSLSLSDTFKQTSSNSTKDLYLEFFDAKNNTMIKNASFFINVTKGDKILMHDLFYTKTGSMTIKFHPGSDMGKWTVNGSLDPILGGWMSQNDTVSVTAPAFTEGTYHIHFSVLALVYVNGIVDQSNPPTFDSWWSVDEKGNISKYDNSTTVSFGPSSNSVGIKDKPPLQQLKSGIKKPDIKCNQDFILIIKKEGHWPACVNPDTVSKLVLRGWTENPLDELLLKYGNQTQANLVFYEIMNEPKVREWSMKGWKYDYHNYAANSETQKSSATIYLSLPSNIGNHLECENGSYALVVLNLRPVEIEHNYTEVGCNIAHLTTNLDPGLNRK